MFNESQVSLFDFVFAISEAVDLAFPSLSGHHMKVTYMSCKIAEEMKLSDKRIKELAIAAVLHDIGSFSLEERMHILNNNADEAGIKDHSELGYKLLKNFQPLKRVAGIIRHHHDHYDPEHKNIPVESYIIHLAEMIHAMFDESGEILDQVPLILEKINAKQSIYHPDVLAAFMQLSKLDYFWIEAATAPNGRIIPERIRLTQDSVNLSVLKGFADVFSHVIDFRSRFTATHSSGIAAVALELTRIAGFSPRECQLMEIAAYMHDLGKLCVSNDVLEKNGKLDHKEFNIMRKHTYYTYSILRQIHGLEQIAEWAAFHHERLDGSGYPFHVAGDDIPALSRIMAVADVFTAITEDRPYRGGLDETETMKILVKMVENGGIDGNIVSLVNQNFAHINKIRAKAQKDALKKYENFYKRANSH